MTEPFSVLLLRPTGCMTSNLLTRPR
ncbi:uncharacterized protein RCC_01704 [Ramularia collo-cygni]|uniref:Uncharacterized protein n=1 Tax=Ramularia collo-cygni TaxID=112498 RepID=A0A2D3UXJ7_9PEZI|nr:uncharacterized protein RCC_01704 [Ramularia collo-cygni]